MLATGDISTSWQKISKANLAKGLYSITKLMNERLRTSSVSTLNGKDDDRKVEDKLKHFETKIILIR